MAGSAVDDVTVAGGRKPDPAADRFSRLRRFNAIMACLHPVDDLMPGTIPGAAMQKL
ncbi:MAG: hypothetical protein ACYCXF_06920 [Thermoleophilia bacterium]